MNKRLIGESIVVINTGLMPSSFNAYWLVKNDILNEDELNNGHIFTEQIVELKGDFYNILINGNSFQLRSQDSLENFSRGIDEKLNKLINATTNTINISSGINFNWELEPEDGIFKELSKKLFYKEGSKLFESFNSEDASFGSYMSKDYEGSRLKLDIKPVYKHNKTNQEKKGSILFNFNFHFDIPADNRNEHLIEFFNKWELYYEESKKIINTLYV